MGTEDFSALKDLIENKIPFNRFIGVRVSSLDRGKCKLYLPYRSELLGDSRRKAIHGGVLSMLIDTCGGFAVWSMCDIDVLIATIDLRVDYLKPVIATGLVADGIVKLLGNRIGNAHIVVYSEGNPDCVVAEGRGVYNVRMG
ncbi:PaaI family thioesterase [Desulfosarcina ovata]|uniref:Thioesterase domain-containing protein n=1 Tax=Desulfosarcina ovata subsp. ovata TaxID=2752305 RepID=A0A5K8A7N6_9BACT|nr:PaaI family thioesterase [Desulfosarcina ovata]BBO88080.1 hypothetical protein DSCOOX_12600 [Desulfosarcina ovata subsp. ovata]